ncbi:HIT family protein [Candidatus Woesearchaeota archaeon]|nr:HIT family protein [Candidatus Woesearchaeota archaeon]
MPCIFCDIITGKNRQKEFILHQDKSSTVFLDQYQVNKGHILIVPNRHYADIFSLPEVLGAELFKQAITFAKKVRTKYRCKGLNIYHCSGKCAGQTIFHFHLHIFPRKPKDGLFRVYPSVKNIKKATEKQLQRYKRSLSK